VSRSTSCFTSSLPTLMEPETVFFNTKISAKKSATGAMFDNTDLIVFTGTGTDDEDGNLYGSSLVWTSTIDGYIGTGTSFSTNLTAGSHTINLTVTDSNGSAHSTDISITVN